MLPGSEPAKVGPTISDPEDLAKEKSSMRSAPVPTLGAGPLNPPGPKKYQGDGEISATKIEHSQVILSDLSQSHKESVHLIF